MSGSLDEILMHSLPYTTLTPSSEPFVDAVPLALLGWNRSSREAAERWFDNFNAVMSHFVGYPEDFADIYRRYSQTP